MYKTCLKFTSKTHAITILQTLNDGIRIRNAIVDPSDRVESHAVIALVVTTIARFLMPFFATDQGPSRFQTVQGTMHMILAVLAFGGLVWAAMGLWDPLSHYAIIQSAKGIVTAYVIKFSRHKLYTTTT